MTYRELQRLFALPAFAVATTLLAFGASHAIAQVPMSLRGQELNIQDQPGYVPSSEEELLPAAFRRQPVYFRTNEQAGTIVIHTSERFLYVVQGGNRAIRYGIGVGREGFQWSGLVRITRKAEWPDWRPPAEMIARQPYLPRFMAGGPGNPMAARWPGAPHMQPPGCAPAPHRYSRSTGVRAPRQPGAGR